VGGVRAVVVTHNRKAMLLACLGALARQTRPVEGVTVVDNASTDGTWEALATSGLGDRMAIEYVRLSRNGGGAEGFHYGVKAALRSDAEWIWLMDDDCEPRPEALAALLESPRARDRGAVLLAPVVETHDGHVLPLNRGWLRPRWFKAPLVPLQPEHWHDGEVRVEHVSLVGPLVRSAAARRISPPRREFFIWFDDLEWTSRLRRLGDLWLVPASRMVHRDERPLPDASPRALVQELLRGEEQQRAWKRAYGVRNIIWTGRRDGWFTPARALAFGAVAGLRSLLSGPPRVRALRLTLLYAYDGWRGRFRNLPPERWPGLVGAGDPLDYLSAHSLGYPADVVDQVRSL
jgi:rhamnopyranosyl-N-acetylglucosaminyl-diphospho-decaprenol beta-1,3/1,4-galactofuranosyltransferase